MIHGSIHATYGPNQKGLEKGGRIFDIIFWKENLKICNGEVKGKGNEIKSCELCELRIINRSL